MRPFMVSLLSGALLLSGCGAGCRKASSAGPTPLERIPAASSVVLHGADVSAAATGVGQLLSRLEAASAKGGGTQAELTTRLGFNPFSDEGWAAAGLSAHGAFAAARVGTGWVWALPLADAAVALATVERLATQLDGATKAGSVQHAGTEIRTWGRPFGSRVVPAVAAATVGDTLLLCTGRDGEALLRTVLAQAPEASFGRRTDVTADGYAGPVHFVVDPAASPEDAQKVAQKLVKLTRGALEVGSTGVRVRAHLDFADGRRVEAQQSLFPEGAALPLLGFAQADAVALGQGALQWDAATGLAEAVRPGSLKDMHTLAGRVGVAVDEGFMKLTDGHLAGAMYMLDPAELADALRRGVNLQKEILHVAPFVVAVRPRAGNTAGDLLERFRALMTQKGFDVGPTAADAQVLAAVERNGPAWRTYRAAEVAGVVLMGAGPPARFEQALQQLRKGAAGTPRGPDDRLMRPGVDTLHIRGPVLAQQLSALASQDLGEGAEALMLRNMLTRVRGMLGKVGTVAVELGKEPQGAQLDVDLPFTALVP
jgi:hypothetical protein